MIEQLMAGILPAGLAAAIGAFALLGVLMMIVLYIYFAFALMTIAKKLGYDQAWLAWIPIVQLVLLPILAKKAWPWVFIFLVPIANAVFAIIWTWKIFERRKYPGWLALVPILGFIPLIGWIASIANLVIWGLVAWRDN